MMGIAKAQGSQPRQDSKSELFQMLKLSEENKDMYEKSKRRQQQQRTIKKGMARPDGDGFEAWLRSCKRERENAEH